MTAGIKHLTRRGGKTWYAVLAVPRPLRRTIGKAHLLRSLGTDDIRVARAKAICGAGGVPSGARPRPPSAVAALLAGDPGDELADAMATSEINCVTAVASA